MTIKHGEGEAGLGTEGLREGDAGDAAAGGVEGVEVAEGLGLGEDAEIIGSARNWQRVVRLGGDVEEEAGGRATLVQLAGGVEVAGAVAECGGDAMALHDAAADAVYGVFECGRRLDEGEDGKVIAGAGLGEEGVYAAGDICWRERTFLLEMVEEFSREVLGLLDVGLVEGVDSEDGTGDGGGELPAEELATQGVTVSEGEAQDGMACGGEAVYVGVQRIVGVASEAEGDEEAVAAVGGGREQRLAGDGDDALSACGSRLCGAGAGDLASAFGDELLHPQAEAGERGGCDEGQLIAAGEGEGGQGSTEGGAGVFVLRRIGAAGAGHADGGGEKGGQVHADDRGRDEAEEGEDGVAPADVGFVDPDAAEVFPLGESGEGCAGVSDGGEMAACGLGTGGGFHEAAEVTVEGEDFDSAAGLGGEKEEGGGGIHGAGDAAHPRGDGGIKDGEAGEAGGAGEDLAEDLGAEAAAAHAEEDDIVDGGGAEGGGEGGERGEVRGGSGGGVKPGEAIGDFGGLGMPDGVVAAPDAFDDTVPGKAAQGGFRAGAEVAEAFKLGRYGRPPWAVVRGDLERWASDMG